MNDISELPDDELTSYEAWCIRTPHYGRIIWEHHPNTPRDMRSMLTATTLRHKFFDRERPDEWDTNGMKYKDTLELLEKNPGFFNSIRHLKDCETRPHKRVFVFSQPRCGSTLLMRMMAGACLTNMIGDKSPEFYQGVLMVYNDTAANIGHYLESPVAKEAEGFFPDMYRGYESRERELWNVKNSLATCLFGKFLGSGYAKSTVLGFGNQLVKPMADMLRHAWDDVDDLRIVWLTRPHDEIINSLQTRETPVPESFKDVGVLKRYLEIQKQQFDEAFEFGDLKITYEDIVTKPDEILSAKKLNPIYQPNMEALGKILANKIR